MVMLVEILKKLLCPDFEDEFDQDLCLNLWYDPIGYFGKMNSTLGSVVPLAMFNIIASLIGSKVATFSYLQQRVPDHVHL